MLIDTHAHIDMLSNPEQSILEAREAGVKEIIIVAQDTSKYGMDIYEKEMLPELLQKIARALLLRPLKRITKK